jgi:hypothetical protein
MKLKTFTPILVLAVFILASCSKKDTTPAVTYKSPSTAHSQITIPAGLQTKANNGDYGALAAETYITMANAMGLYASDFTLPSGQNTTATSNGAIYSWAYGDEAFWMTYAVLSDKYTWTYDYKTAQLSRFTFIYAEEFKNGTAGSWKINNPDGTGAVVWDYSWTLAGSVYNATLNMHNSDLTIDKFVVLDNGDNSGTFKYFEGSIEKAEITWNANGTGSWWFSDDGITHTSSGTWTASGK